jgi:hypothetical protein
VRTGRTTGRQPFENAVNSEKREVQALLHDKDKNRATEILTVRRFRLESADCY